MPAIVPSLMECWTSETFGTSGDWELLAGVAAGEVTVAEAGPSEELRPLARMPNEPVEPVAEDCVEEAVPVEIVEDKKAVSDFGAFEESDGSSSPLPPPSVTS